MSFHQMNSIDFFFFFILTSSISGLKFLNGLGNKKDCCIAPKTNVNSQKANAGKELLQRLTIQSDIHEEVTPEKMCYFVHFLFQQASINKKPIKFSKGMFVIFDSTNQLFDSLIQMKTSQLSTTKPLTFRQHLRESLPIDNALKHLVRRAIKSKSISSTNLDERYPTYGMDIPKSCLPSSFDHVLLGELPSFNHPKKYIGRRFFLQPDHFGYDRTRITSVLKNYKDFLIGYTKQRLCRLIKGEVKAECAKLIAFKKNMDRGVLRKWKKVLSKLPSKWKIDRTYKEHAIKYGIREIDQQSRDLKSAGAGRSVEKFRKYLQKKYGSDDLSVRKGREIILTVDELLATHPTCESSSNSKCSTSFFKSLF